jgi:hypothetical protein
MEVDKQVEDTTTSDTTTRSGTDGDTTTSATEAMEECRFDQWVDYLPHHLGHDTGKGPDQVLKRFSLDVTESHLTSSQEDDSSLMDTENWPDSASLEDYAMVPNALLVEHDPLLQHELLLTDPAIMRITSQQFTSCLQDVLEERRRVLMASMEASQRTRRCLEPHIKQRASLASVLSDIEGSSKTLREHVLQDAASTNAMIAAATMMEEEEEEMLASSLDLDEPPPPPPPPAAPAL